MNKSSQNTTAYYMLVSKFTLSLPSLNHLKLLIYLDLIKDVATHKPINIIINTTINEVAEVIIIILLFILSLLPTVDIFSEVVCSANKYLFYYEFIHEQL